MKKHPLAEKLCPFYKLLLPLPHQKSVDSDKPTKTLRYEEDCFSNGSLADYDYRSGSREREEDGRQAAEGCQACV